MHGGILASKMTSSIIVFDQSVFPVQQFYYSLWPIFRIVWGTSVISCLAGHENWPAVAKLHFLSINPFLSPSTVYPDVDSHIVCPIEWHLVFLLPIPAFNLSAFQFVFTLPSYFHEFHLISTSCDHSFQRHAIIHTNVMRSFIPTSCDHSFQRHAIIHSNVMRSFIPTSCDHSFQRHAIIHSNVMRSFIPTSCDHSFQRHAIIHSNVMRSFIPTSCDHSFQRHAIIHFNVMRSFIPTSCDHSFQRHAIIHSNVMRSFISTSCDHSFQRHAIIHSLIAAFTILLRTLSPEFIVVTQHLN